MQSTDLSALRQLRDDWKHVLDEIPNSRRALHEQLAALGKKEVDAQISSAGNPAKMKNTARVKQWQVKQVGSRGGYAAVRAAGGATGPDSPGAITNYLENGHKIRPAKKKQRKKLNVSYINGFHFYAHATAALEAAALSLCQTYVDELAERMGGA